MKLSKAQEAERNELRDRLTDVKNALDEKLVAANEAIGEANAALTEYNSVVAEMETFAEGIASEIEDFISEKSERWQEGERGQAVAAMLGEWQSADFTQPDAYEELPEPEDDPADTLDGLPSDPDNFL
jgi:hypothetical protein